ncbi:MAG: sel1 repeat family protein [Pseudomonadota bacterium]|nr:sel1 repeat family protein [Pseudomonadota bacterium]QKK04743.1 MAG: sel1 repeat family protein [Pseudomonadota bacterium]
MRKTIFTALVLTLCLAISVPAYAAKDKKTEEKKFADDFEEYRSLGIGLLLKEGQEHLLSGMEDNSQALRTEKGAANIVELSAQLDEAFAIYAEEKYEEAFEKFITTARAGSAEAQEMVGMMFAQGQGTKQDDVQALRWLERAAQNFQPLAMHHVGVRYFGGQGVKRDVLNAAKWLSLSVEFYGDDTSDASERARQDLKNMMARLSLREQRQVQNAVREWRTENKAGIKIWERTKSQQEQIEQQKAGGQQ